MLAPLTRFLIDEYGSWRGAIVILAGLILNMYDSFVSLLIAAIFFFTGLAETIQGT